MSYVLQALQKREAEQNPDAAVALSLVAARTRRQRLWAGLIAAGLLLNAGLLVWLFAPPLAVLSQGSQPAADAPARASAVPAAAPLPSGAAGALPPPSPTTRPAAADPQANSVPALSTGAPVGSATAAAAAPPQPAAAAVEETARPAPRLRRIALADLPASARTRFPGIAFSSHIYSDDPSLRAVVANGHRVSEGERIAGLVVGEITEAGVVLEFEDYLVEVPVVSLWNEN
ncbi:MAG: general secretion pathway protein GspB [Pseudomonadales bacterium]